MKKIFIVLGFISAILAVILATTPLSNLSIAPIIIAFVCGLIVLFLSKKQKEKAKTIQYIFLLTIIALGLTIYKSVLATAKLGNIEELEQREEQNLEDSKEILEELDIDEDL